jgi:hypothetical protein
MFHETNCYTGIKIGGLIQFWVWLFTFVEYKPKYLRGKASTHTGTYDYDS